MGEVVRLSAPHSATVGPIQVETLLSVARWRIERIEETTDVVLREQAATGLMIAGFSILSRTVGGTRAAELMREHLSLVDPRSRVRGDAGA